ncbi:hypothetical protein [Brevibacterium litoralis]|uniref:hypothetical protein n=1 Tax=Brevibacterium litoralis TaxID=3138935 RepID=UPI0032ECDEAF
MTESIATSPRSLGELIKDNDWVPQLTERDWKYLSAEERLLFEARLPSNPPLRYGVLRMVAERRRRRRNPLYALWTTLTFIPDGR